MPSMKEILDLDNYPLDRLDDADGRAFAERCRWDFVATGLCRLPGFLRPDARAAMAAESLPLAPGAFFHRAGHNVYLDDGDANLPADHPRRRRVDTFIGSIAYDELPDGGWLKTLYGWPGLTDFVARVVGADALHHLDDPLGACSVNVCGPGGKHGWHYDESEFTITLMLQQPAGGGDFDYVPGLRGAEGEDDRLARLLDGDAEEVVHLPFEEGCLLIFNGHESLHRVTPVSGDRLRLVPVLCYADRPGIANSPEVRTMFWGREG